MSTFSKVMLSIVENNRDILRDPVGSRIWSGWIIQGLNSSMFPMNETLLSSYICLTRRHCHGCISQRTLRLRQALLDRSILYFYRSFHPAAFLLLAQDGTEELVVLKRNGVYSCSSLDSLYRLFALQRERTVSLPQIYVNTLVNFFHRWWSCVVIGFASQWWARTRRPAWFKKVIQLAIPLVYIHADLDIAV